MKTIKKLLLSLFMLFFLQHAIARTDSIEISGNLKGLQNNGVWLSFTTTNKVVKNFKTNAVNDDFKFKVPKMEMPVLARFNVAIPRDMSAMVDGKMISNPAPALDLFIYNQNINITGEALLVQFSAVKGDNENNIFNTYKKQVLADEKLSYETSLALFNATYHNKPLKGDINTLKEEAINTRKRIAQNQKEFIKQNPKAFAAIFLLSRMQNLYNANDYTNAWNGLADLYKNHPAADGIKNYLKKVSSTLAGIPAIPFERKDKDGKTINLADYKGKVVLLDFWGSWCGPCRASHPHLKTVYDKYKAKGFEIIAIAQEYGKTLAQSKLEWLKAIEEDKIKWVHILNQDGIEQQDIVKSYNVNGFPTKILVDAQGKIILRVTASATDDIDKALEKIYGF
jgi:thiol-disulfide isomerase/thioredoxin